MSTPRAFERRDSNIYVTIYAKRHALAAFLDATLGQDRRTRWYQGTSGAEPTRPLRGYGQLACECCGRPAKQKVEMDAVTEAAFGSRGERAAEVAVTDAGIGTQHKK